MPYPPRRIARLALSGIIAAAVIPLFAAAPQTDEGADVLAGKGLKLVKKKYILLDAEGGVARAYQTSLAKIAEANQAIAEAGDLAAKNDAIAGYWQRIAYHRAFGDEMQMAMRDGATPEEQQGFRGARLEARSARKERAQQGLARANARPREEKRLIAAAEDACKAAESARTTLVDKVSEVAARYRELYSDQELVAAAGAAKIGPSDGFARLAKSLGVAIEPPKAGESNAKRSPGEMPADTAAALRELTLAAEALRKAEFKKEGPLHESRDRRRNETVDLIETAIAKLKRGESAAKSIEEASASNNGYSNPKRMTPQVRASIDEAGERLTKALRLIPQQ